MRPTTMDISAMGIKALFLGLLLGWVAVSASSGDTRSEQDFLLGILREEMELNFKSLTDSEDLSPYYMAYRIHDTLRLEYSANWGGTLSRAHRLSRYVDVELRVGDPNVDNTHALRDLYDMSYMRSLRNQPLPIDSNAFLLRKNLRLATDDALVRAQERYRQVLANQAMRPEEDEGMDFSFPPDTRVYSLSEPETPDTVALGAYFEKLRMLSSAFAAMPWVLRSSVSYRYERVDKRFADSQRNWLGQSEMRGRLDIHVEGKAEDGLKLWQQKSFPMSTALDTVPIDTVAGWIHLLGERLKALHDAPVMEPYDGPVLLDNLAAAVFVHEVFGHRVEGHRQKAVDEGQTFAAKVGMTITAPFISIHDDPTLSFYGGAPLSGAYRFDDEGVRAQRVVLVDKGVFRGFLLSRALVDPGVPSNGHGRGDLGQVIVARMGNTILETDRPVSRQQMRQELLALAGRKGLEFALIVHDISGGFTYTGRDLPQSFKVEPLRVTRVFVDGRPDELVRGLDMTGTPLVSFKQIRATGDDPEVFNGFCGAESGWVPVASVSPSLLLEHVEFEKKVKDANKPPILPPPTLGKMD